MAASLRTIIVCCLIIGGALAASVSMYLNKEEPAKKILEHSPLLIDVAEVVKQDVPITITSQGTVSARTETTLIAEISGRVVNVSPAFEAGGFFETGEVLLQLDDRDYRAELKRAEAAVASARSNLSLERGRAEVAYRDWLKFSQGVRRNPEADALAQRKPQLEEAQAKLDSAEADLARARDNLDRTRIRLPYTGMVRSKLVDIGQYVTPGTQLGKTFATDKLEVRLPLPDDRISYINLPKPNTPFNDAPAVVLSAQLGDTLHEWNARIVRTEGVLDERSRVLFLVAEVEDPYGLHNPQLNPLRVGTFVNAEIAGKTMPEIVVLPRHILRTGNQVWVVDEKNRLINRKVKLLRTDGDLVYIHSGLENGERVSLSAIPHAVAGSEIEPNHSVKTSALLQPKSVATDSQANRPGERG